MNEERKKALYAYVWRKPEAQTNKVVEELLELALELSRLESGRTTEERIAEELADVILTTEGLAQYLKIGDSVEKYKSVKLIRLAKRIKAGTLWQ